MENADARDNLDERGKPAGDSSGTNSGGGTGAGDVRGSAGGTLRSGGGGGGGDSALRPASGTNSPADEPDGTPGTPGNGSSSAGGSPSSGSSAGGDNGGSRNTRRRSTGRDARETVSESAEEQLLQPAEKRKLVGDVETVTFEMPGAEKPAGTRTRRKAGDTAPSDKATPDSLSTLLMALFYMYGQTRPESVRSCWIFNPDELRPVAEPAAKILNRIGGKALQSVMMIADPIALLLGIHGLMEEGKRREYAEFVKFLNTNPDAAKDYAAFLQRQQRGRRARQGETAFDPSAGNGYRDEVASELPVTDAGGDTSNLPRN